MHYSACRSLRRAVAENMGQSPSLRRHKPSIALGARVLVAHDNARRHTVTLADAETHSPLCQEPSELVNLASPSPI